MGQEGVRRTEERRENPGSHSWRDSRSVQTNRGGTPRRSPLPHRFTPQPSSHSLPPLRSCWREVGAVGAVVGETATGERVAEFFHQSLGRLSSVHS